MTVALNLSTSGGTENLEGEVTITASPTQQVTEVSFYVDETFTEKDTVAPFEYLWDTTAVEAGTHQLKAKARYSRNQVVWDQLLVTVLDQELQPELPIPISEVDAHPVLMEIEE